MADIERTPIDRAVDLVGLRQLAAGCGVSYQAVQKWQKKGEPPPRKAGLVESLCAERGEQITRRQLCPEFPWDEPVDGCELMQT